MLAVLWRNIPLPDYIRTRVSLTREKFLEVQKNILLTLSTRDGSYILLACYFVAADYLAPSVLPILLMLLAIDTFLCNFAHHSILMYVIVSSLLHTLSSFLKSTSYSFIAICVDYLLV